MSGAGSAGSGLGRHALTTVNGDFDELLRRALHAEADSIEPAAGGLERIRHRISAPWLVRQMSLMLTDCVDLVRLIGIRLEPGLTSTWGAIAGRAGSWRASCARLCSQVSILARIWALIGPSRHSATHRGSPQRGNLAWLRPALAVAAAVFIVAVGVYGLGHMKNNLVLDLFSGGTEPANSSSSNPGAGHDGLTPAGQSASGFVPPASSGTPSASPSPTATCSGSPASQVTPTPTASATVTPTGSPSTSPSPAPSDSTNPTPTGTTTSTPPTNGTASIQSSQPASDPATSCGQSSAGKSPSPSPTG